MDIGIALAIVFILLLLYRFYITCIACTFYYNLKEGLDATNTADLSVLIDAEKVTMSIDGDIIPITLGDEGEHRITIKNVPYTSVIVFYVSTFNDASKHITYYIKHGKNEYRSFGYGQLAAFPDTIESQDGFYCLADESINQLPIKRLTRRMQKPAFEKMCSPTDYKLFSWAQTFQPVGSTYSWSTTDNELYELYDHGAEGIWPKEFPNEWYLRIPLHETSPYPIYVQAYYMADDLAKVFFANGYTNPVEYASIPWTSIVGKRFRNDSEIFPIYTMGYNTGGPGWLCYRIYYFNEDTGEKLIFKSNETVVGSTLFSDPKVPTGYQDRNKNRINWLVYREMCKAIWSTPDFNYTTCLVVTNKTISSAAK